MFGALNAFMTITPAAELYELWSWGRNESGQLGLNNTTTTSSPVQVGTTRYWTNVYMCSFGSGGDGMTFARKTNGTLWSWGKNNYGYLGHNDTISRSSPTQIGSLGNWSSKFSPGGFATLAIKIDGTLWSWGSNTNYGLCGLGDTIARSSPVQVGTLTTWATVAAPTSWAAAAIKTDGTLWTWGGNNFGTLGQAIPMQSSPVQVGSLTNWSQVTTIGAAMLAIKTNGTLWSWGGNFYGVLGQEDTIHRSSPVQIGSLTTWASLMRPQSTTNVIAVQTNGTLWTWGSNQTGYPATGAGQLGLGDTVNRSSPVQVGTLTTWTSVTAGLHAAGAIKSPGALWTFGLGTYGTLGQNSTISRSSPVQVGTATNWQTISMGESGMALRG